jgi:hypothetical protein
MSERRAISLELSTLNLSPDGGRILPGERGRAIDVSIDDALAALRSFAQVSAMALIDVEAKIYLAGPRGKIAVQNVGGRLFAAAVPEAINPATETTPEQTVARLVGEDVPGFSPESEIAAQREAEALAAVERRAGGWRAALSSPWALAILMPIVAAMAYFSFGPTVADGIEIVRDPGRIANLHATFNGRYGDPGATVLELNSGKLAGKRKASAGRAEETIFERSYRFGLRGDAVVLVVDNGAILDAQPDRSLVFLSSTYPRLEK